MTKEMYWAIFLKTSNRYSGMVSMPLPEDINFSDSASFANDFEHNTWGSDNTITNAHAHSGKFSAIVDDKQNYSPTLFVKCGALPQQPHLYAYIDLWMFLTSLRSDSRLVVSIESADRNAYYYTADLLKRRLDDTNTWQEQDFMYELPAFKNKEDILKVYVFGTKGTAYIDDFRVKFGVLKEGK